MAGREQCCQGLAVDLTSDTMFDNEHNNRGQWTQDRELAMVTRQGTTNEDDTVKVSDVIVFLLNNLRLITRLIYTSSYC